MRGVTADSPALKSALEDLERLHPKKIDLGLERIERVLDRLGNPHHSLPPTVHIAGTNGKGSTVALLKSMAEAQGLKVHVYSSPHLVSFRERIVLGGEMISEQALLEILDRVLKANDGKPLSFFEATTAAAFTAFNETPGDLLILETGLGGRYDATNVVARPALTAITPIDYDHAEFLGRDLAGIAREKAGIMKRHAPVYCGEQTDLVQAVLEAEANKHRAAFKALGEHFQCYAQHGRLVFEDDGELLDLPLPSLRGQHQIQNSGLAIALARALQIDYRAIAGGLTSAYWPARLQPLTTGPLVEIASKRGAELWLDGGHNPHAGRALASSIASLEAKSSRPLIMIMGMLANKNAPGFLDAFDGLARAVIAVPIADHQAYAPEALIDIAKGRGMHSQACDTLPEAVKTACGLSTDTPPRILICGSLYLAGQVLADNG